ncbi:MAG: phage holin family protein [Tannerellaceae bacterium]
MGVAEYTHKLFDDKILVFLGACWVCIGKFLFPSAAMEAGAVAVLIVMILDLLTRLFAQARKAGGYRKALLAHEISSNKFARGTMDKLVVFGVMLVLCACAYKLTVIEDVATWFTQVVFAIMFLRDALSIVENLADAGVKNMAIFKKVFKKKLEEITDVTEEETTTEETTAEQPTSEDTEVKG